MGIKSKGEFTRPRKVRPPPAGLSRALKVVSKTDAQRRLGVLAGLGRVPSDFDAPLPDALLDAFEGRESQD